MTTSSVLGGYDWADDYRALGIAGTYIVTMPAGLSLVYNWAGYEGQAAISVDTSALGLHDVVTVKAPATATLTASSGDNMEITVSQDKTTWTHADSETGMLTVAGETDNEEKGVTFAGNLVITISSKAEY